MPHHNRTETIQVAGLQLEPGETIDFVVDLKQNLNHEEFLWDVTITELANQENKDSPPRRWNTQRDFAGPKTQPLTPWEQLAQVLLVANEFIFID